MQWVEPYTGFEIDRIATCVTRDYQEEKFAALGLDAGIYGDRVDPSFYIGLGIHAGIASGISAEGNVNMLSGIIQHRPVALGERLYSAGHIESVEPVPRGRRVITDVWFEDEAGRRAVSVPRQSLKPDPEKSSRGAGDRPPPVIENASSLQVIGEYPLTPEGTRGYSTEGNAIHYEEDVAQAAGFRAPIIGGGQGVHYLMWHLWRKGIDSVNLTIFFRRPIFWDDVIQVGIAADESAIALLREGRGGEPSKVLTEIRINELERHGS